MVTRTLSSWGALAALVLSLLVGGCKGRDPAPTSFGVNVTIDARQLSTADRAKIVSGRLVVTGDEPATKTMQGIQGAIGSGELRFRYIPNVRTGTLQLAFDALDAGNQPVAGGASDAVQLQAQAVAATIRLTAGAREKANGETCAAAAECTSGFCADGVCCNEACDETCASCALEDTRGTCTPYAEGTDPELECGATLPPDGGAPEPDAGASDAGADAAPSDAGTDAAVITFPDGGVTSTPSTCAGTCSGARSCRYPGATTSCGGKFCNDTQDLAQMVCNGSGGCDLALASCQAYACGAAAASCNTSCASHDDCGADHYCKNAVCLPRQGPGLTCVSNRECATGFCVSGVCCNTSCETEGSTCNQPNAAGTCKCIGVTCAAGVSCQLFYQDADGDGFGNKAGTIAAGTAAAGCAGAPPAGFVDDKTDCDDGDATVNRNQTAFFATPSRGTGTFDYNCDGSVQKETPEFPGASCQFCGARTACETMSTSCAADGASSALQCTYLVSRICISPILGGTCSGSGGICLTASSGFTATIACGASGSKTTCGTCAAVGGSASRTTQTVQQKCH